MLNYSKNQIKILEIFFNNPDKEYYLRELARIVGKEPGVFQREINRLETEGLLESYFVANSRFFKINKSNPLYNEYKAIFSKTIGIEGSLRNLIEESSNIDAAFIYGSIASGKETGTSDIDLFIIGNPDESNLIKNIDALEKKLSREINYMIYTKEEFKEKISKKDSFIDNLIKRSKILLKGNLDEL